MNNEVTEEMKYDAENAGPAAGNCGEDGDEATVFRFSEFCDDDCLTRAGMLQTFQCSERTLFRMVERYEIPPAIPFAGRSVWVIGRLKAWIAAAARNKEAEALDEAKRLNILK